MAMSLVVSWACVGACFAALVFEIQAMRCQCYPNTLLAAGDFASAGTIKHTLLQYMGQISCVRTDQLNAPSPLLASSGAVRYQNAIPLVSRGLSVVW